MTPPVSTYPWLILLPAAAGIAFGWGYFATLRHATAVFAAAGSVAHCIGWLLLRLGAACLFFALTVHWGPWPLLAAFLGFLGSRQIALRTARSAA
jgi:hypothetical protein